MNAMINTEVAVSKVGIIITPNQPIYKRFSVEVIYEQKRLHRVSFGLRVTLAAMIKKNKIKMQTPKNRTCYQKYILYKQKKTNIRKIISLGL